MILKWNDSHLICMRIIAAPEEEQQGKASRPLPRSTPSVAYRRSRHLSVFGVVAGVTGALTSTSHDIIRVRSVAKVYPRRRDESSLPL